MPTIATGSTFCLVPSFMSGACAAQECGGGASVLSVLGRACQPSGICATRHDGGRQAATPPPETRRPVSARAIRRTMLRACIRENISTENPQLLTIAVISAALPSMAPACCAAPIERQPSASSRRNRLRKWIVSSSTMPSATLATITVATFSEIPSQPIAPRTASTGKRFGTIARSPYRTERKIRKIATKIVRRRWRSSTSESARGSGRARLNRRPEPATVAAMPVSVKVSDASPGRPECARTRGRSSSTAGVPRSAQSRSHWRRGVRARALPSSPSDSKQQLLRDHGRGVRHTAAAGSPPCTS